MYYQLVNALFYMVAFQFMSGGGGGLVSESIGGMFGEVVGKKGVHLVSV